MRERLDSARNERLARVGWGLPLACAGALLAGSCWAWWPVESATVSPPAIAASSPLAAGLPSPLELDAFRAPLWIVAALPPPPSAPPAPPPPLKLQLLAIVQEGEIYKAAIYDPDTDRVFVSSSGESVGRYRVQNVALDSAEVLDGARVRRLALDQQDGRR